MTPAVFEAAKAVVEAARENLDGCASWMPGNMIRCGEPATHTINSDSHPACPTHAAQARKGNNSVFDHRQSWLLRALNLYDARVADAAREAMRSDR